MSVMLMAAALIWLYREDLSMGLIAQKSVVATFPSSSAPLLLLMGQLMVVLLLPDKPINSSLSVSMPTVGFIPLEAKW